MMSRKLVTLVYERRIGSLMRKAVLAYMADRANDDGSGIWVSKTRIAREIEASRSGVITAIQGMEKDGLLCNHGMLHNRSTYEYSIIVHAVKALPLANEDENECANLHTDPCLNLDTPLCLNLDTTVQKTTGGVYPVDRGCLPSGHEPSFNRPLKEGADLSGSDPDEQTLSAMRAQGLSSPAGQSWLSMIDTLRQHGKLSLRDKDAFKRAVQGVDGDDLILSEDYEPPEALLDLIEASELIEGEEEA